MATIGYIQIGMGWYGATPTDWTNVLTLDDSMSSFSGVNTPVGLSWRKMGTTGGAPSDFSASESVNTSLSGNITVSLNNDITISGLVLAMVNAVYDVTQPGTNVVGATFTYKYDPSGATVRTHTKADNEAVGSGFTVPVSGTFYPSNQAAAASTSSSGQPVMYVHESATNTVGRRWVRIVNILPPDYRPGQRLQGGTWYSHNRSGGKADKRAGGSWATMRTLNGGVGSGDPPTIRVSGSFKNQHKIGTGA